MDLSSVLVAEIKNLLRRVGKIGTDIFLLVHSCFSCLVNCGAATMKNGFQVTVLDSEALKS